MAYKETCVASEYFPEKCSGHYTTEDRCVPFKYRDDYSVEHVSLCSFHYEWLKSMNKKDEVLEMRGETPEDAVDDDLLEKFKLNNIYRVWNRRSKKFPSGEGTMYLLEGNYKDNLPLKGDENIWELKGVFCYDGYDAHTKKNV